MADLTREERNIQIYPMKGSWKSILKNLPGAVMACVLFGTPVWGQETNRSSVLTSEAWAALERQDYAAARAAVARCQTLYAAQAAEMQKSLTALPGKETTHQYWALNDVGTCQLILGKVAEAEGKKDEAKAAYRLVLDRYSYSQCWDKQGWFWQPAVAARERLAALTLDSDP